jgi:NAD(P)-dependent dehydrogenase (short-subunit alcohol dehydrogenase family)
MNLSGKTAVVTGAARGIGRAYCERLAAEGGNVVVIDKSNTETVEEVAKSLRGAGKKLGITADVSEPDQIASACSIVLERFGRCDIFVNNAAWMPVLDLQSITSEVWRKVQATNVEPIVLFSQAFVPGMLKGGWGRIVTNGSGITLSQIADLAYMSSKGSVHAVTRALANELAGTPITVNSIAPTVVKTPGFIEHTRPTGPRCFGNSRRGEAVGRRDLSAAEQGRVCSGRCA